MSTAFGDADHRLGGGHVRRTLLTYLDQVLGPLLHGTYSDASGRALYAAAGRLLDLAAFITFDAGLHGAATRYYQRALALVDLSTDQALCAHVLTDMTMQALYLVDRPRAVQLANAAVDRARRSGSASSLARSHAVQARALALAGEAAASDEAASAAEHALDQARPDSEPVFVRFFDARQLATEKLYAAYDLGRSATVRAANLAPPDGTMQRRHVLATATVASALLTPGEATDIPAACAHLRAVTPLLPSLASARGLAAINAVRRSLASYEDQPEVRAVEEEITEALCAAA